jgi:hypothetical protein
MKHKGEGQGIDGCSVSAGATSASVTHPTYYTHPSHHPRCCTATCDLRAQQPAIALPALLCTLLNDGALPVQRRAVATQALPFPIAIACLGS